MMISIIENKMNAIKKNDWNGTLKLCIVLIDRKHLEIDKILGWRAYI